MKLNLGGNCQKTFIAALGLSLLALFALILPRSNKYADIPEKKAAQAITSENEILTIRKGETIRILGAREILPKKHEKGDKTKHLMLSVQNSKGERDFVLASEVVTLEEIKEMMPELRHHEFSNSSGAFNRRTLSSAEFDAIQAGMTVEEVEKILYPEERMQTVDGILTGKYDKIDVFVKKTGRFYIPVIRYQDGKVSDIELKSYYNTHQNAWLLKFLPGTQWIYSHNIFNSMSQKKSFGRSNYNSNENIEIDMNNNFFSKLFGYILVILIFLVLVAFYLLVPAIPAMFTYGVFVFPDVVKHVSNRSMPFIMGAILIVFHYYVWVAYMPYVAWWISLPVMYMVIMFFLGSVFNDSLCDRCGFMNFKTLDHSEFVREYDTTKKETESHALQERRKITRTAKEITERNGYGQTRKYEENVNYHTHTETDYRNDKYDVTYHVKEYKDYYRCKECGLITIRERSEREVIDKQFLGSYNSTSSSDSDSPYKPL